MSEIAYDEAAAERASLVEDVEAAVEARVEDGAEARLVNHQRRGDDERAAGCGRDEEVVMLER